MKWAATIAAALALTVSTPTMAEFGAYGMSGLRLAVVDDAKSIRFYKHLGMKVGRLYHPGQQEMTFPKPDQGPNIILTHKDATNKMIPGQASLIMFVPDLVQTMKDLRGDGFTVPDVKPGKGNYTEYAIQDPDGNAILLVGPTPK